VWDLLGDPLAVVRVLRDARADVICLQEAPRWPGSRWRLGALARASGLQFLAGGRGSAGTAMLCSPRAEAVAEAVRLPVQGWRTRPRGAVIGRVGLPGRQPVTLACVHLGLAPAERAVHVGLLLQRLGPWPVVVAGDLNEPPGGPSWTALAAVVVDPAPDAAPTFPAVSPRRRIDAVLVSPGVRVETYGAPPSEPVDVRSGSDHLPVLAELALPSR
jgi:endonuclease/exonuclease/phosphatase family metal-dependent hydrolase